MCNEIGQAVASVLAIIFTAVSDYYGGQPKPAPKSQAQCSPQSPSFNSYQDMFVAAMEDHGLQYADILPGIPTHGIKKRRDGEPELLERFLIRGFLHIHYPVKSAFQVNYYSNGSVVVNSSLGAVEDLISGLGERYDNPGLKVTCSMERYNERDLYERDYHPLVGMTSDITGYWTGSGTTVSRPEYTGYDSEAEGEDMINFYFEIIPWI
ncbi:hypothetical protein N7507_007985 [Penicillium longicatenatum]|nr:hypothetical protein N7507_007985 [Penicillium longicatenatum]